MTEQQIQQEILIALGRRPDCRVWRQNSGTAPSWDGKRVVRFGVPGCADISGLLIDGRRLEIEVKKAGGKQSPDQVNFQRMIERFGGVYMLVYSVAEAVAGVDAAIARKKGGPSEAA